MQDSLPSHMLLTYRTKNTCLLDFYNAHLLDYSVFIWYTALTKYNQGGVILIGTKVRTEQSNLEAAASESKQLIEDKELCNVLANAVRYGARFGLDNTNEF